MSDQDEQPQDVDGEPFSVLVRLYARPDKVDAAEGALTKIAEPTRANPDCLEFRILHSTDDPQIFILFERWVNWGANNAHGGQDYMAEYLATKDELFESIDGDFIEEVQAPEAS